MKKSNRVKVSMVLFAGAVTAVIASAAVAVGPFGGGCNKGTFCLDVYKPVLCPNGQIYSNDCYAAKACQHNCIPADTF